MIAEKQKCIIMNFLAKKDYGITLCVSGHEYLDTEEPFTEFNCQEMEDKKLYLEVINEVSALDPKAQAYVDIYGLEEDETTFITSETLWLKTVLSIEDIEAIFRQMNDKYQCYCSPSSIGIISENEIKKGILVDKNGRLIEMSKELKMDGKNRLIFCWWD